MQVIKLMSVLLDHHKFYSNNIQEINYVGISAYEAAKDLVTTQKVDAIMTTSQSITLGTYKAIINMELKIPDDGAVFGYDDLAWMEAVNPPISTTHQPNEEIAKKACEILFSVLDNGDEPIQTYCIDSHLIIRESCGCKVDKEA